MIWEIVKVEGDYQPYQVSDGPIGERSISYDFKTLAEAEDCLVRLQQHHNVDPVGPQPRFRKELSWDGSRFKEEEE